MGVPKPPAGAGHAEAQHITVPGRRACRSSAPRYDFALFSLKLYAVQRVERSEVAATAWPDCRFCGDGSWSTRGTCSSSGQQSALRRRWARTLQWRSSLQPRPARLLTSFVVACIRLSSTTLAVFSTSASKTVHATSISLPLPQSGGLKSFSIHSCLCANCFSSFVGNCSTGPIPCPAWTSPDFVCCVCNWGTRSGLNRLSLCSGALARDGSSCCSHQGALAACPHCCGTVQACRASVCCCLCMLL